MSTRVVSLFLSIGLLALVGCAPRINVRNFTSGQVSAGVQTHDVRDHVLTDTQLAALSNWITAHDDWSGMTLNIPEHPSIEVDMQGADGQGTNLTVYEHENGTATAYLYHAHRVAPLMRKLSASDLATLKSIISGQ
jgi:hypothetical protein